MSDWVYYSSVRDGSIYRYNKKTGEAEMLPYANNEERAFILNNADGPVISDVDEDFPFVTSATKANPTVIQLLQQKKDAGVITDSKVGVSSAVGDPDPEVIRQAGEIPLALSTAGQTVGGNQVASAQPVGQPQQLNETASPEVSNLPPELQALYQQLSDYLTELERRGQQINPDIELTPELVAEFLKQAEGEINPYFEGQLQLARESLLTSFGYSRDQLVDFENRLEQRYGRAVRRLGESAAEQGFALSGLRRRDEGQLATDTQADIEANRRQLQFQAGQQARQFAQQFGTSELPTLELGATPQAVPGEVNFAQAGRTLPLYQLDPSVYDGLIGQQEFARRGAVQARASELESAERTKRAISQQRQLTL